MAFFDFGGGGGGGGGGFPFGGFPGKHLTNYCYKLGYMNLKQLSIRITPYSTGSENQIY
jgi:hypothetical protein